MPFRSRLRWFAPLVATFLTAAGASPIPESAAHADGARSVRLSSYDAHLFADINQARAQVHRSSLVLAAGTTDVARGWTCTMAANQRLAHRPDLVQAISHHGSPNWTVIGENVGMTGSYDPRVLFGAYMHSAEHRANILDRDYRYVGIHTTRSGGTLWNALDFVDSYSGRYGPTRDTC